MPVSRLSTKSGTDHFLITNGSGIEVSCISIGASISAIKLSDGTDVVLGFKDVNDYRTNTPYIGCSVGRVANRIRDAKFILDGQTYEVSANVTPHTLHGGETGFNKADWSVLKVGEESVCFQHVSRAGDMGYPGTLTATVTYSLTSTGEVMVEYSATTDKPTIVNLVNHTYFNLAQKGTIHDHVLKVNATTYTPLDEQLIAKGMLEPVSGTALEFTMPTALGLRMAEVGGYDINYNVMDSEELHPQLSHLHLCATLSEPLTGHELKVYSNQPGVQLYTGNFLDGCYREKDCSPPIVQHAGVCLETQAWPNAINIPGAESQVILRPEDTYYSSTLWQFK